MSSIGASRYTILCVDDNQNNLFTLNALLSTVENIRSIEVLGGKEALDVLLKEPIDLILCDVQMPDINGFELAKMIKSNKKTRDIPIIFVTAVFKSQEFVDQGFEIGAVDYLTKPIDDHQLLNKINLYLKIHEQKNVAIHNEKRFHEIAQSISDGIYTLNTQNETTFINNEALSLLGYRREELVGKKIHDFIHYKDKHNKPIPASECKVHRCMVTNKAFSNNDTVFVKKDGSFLPVSIKVTPLRIDNEVVGSVTVFKDKTIQEKVVLLEHEKLQNQEQIILSMIDMIESRDSYTAGHTKRVAQYCVLIAQEMGYSEEEIDLLKNAAWLHDIGKISTPDSVLLKPGKLDNTEYKLIKEHLNAGYQMLKNIDAYKEIAEIMHEHHEKYDGSGYPQGLKGEAIKPLSRIMIVADAFDAMTTNRIYKAKKSVKVALKELEALSAKHFHPEVVSAAIVALKDISVAEDISQLPKTVTEEKRFAYFYRDRLTNLFVIDYLELIVRYYMDSKSAYKYEIQLHKFSEYNKHFGWKSGDVFIVSFAKFLQELYEESITFRVEGDDFMILSEVPLKNLAVQVESYIALQEGDVSVSITENFIEDVKSLISC